MPARKSTEIWAGEDEESGVDFLAGDALCSLTKDKRQCFEDPCIQARLPHSNRQEVPSRLVVGSMQRHEGIKGHTRHCRM
mmetsp:Transcript_2792/g.3684  ORF Transcript_2792/g.3684 Transcript_2792/m.3684 type:complete len:80 (+) Transcript_2792:99-338(+)